MQTGAACRTQQGLRTGAVLFLLNTWCPLVCQEGPAQGWEALLAPRNSSKIKVILDIIWTFVLSTSCFDSFCWVVLIASGFMINCGRSCFLIRPEFLLGHATNLPDHLLPEEEWPGPHWRGSLWVGWGETPGRTWYRPHPPIPSPPLTGPMTSGSNGATSDLISFIFKTGYVP